MPAGDPSHFNAFKTLFARGSYGNSGTKAEFNKAFQGTKNPILRREAKPPAAYATHRDIYFVRKTKPESFDEYQNMLVTWSLRNNVFNKDFSIYSTLDDALNDKN